jgi:mono/diheme cytochrome c family protein
LKKHFLTPASVTPGSAMPPQKLAEADLEAITLFMLSQTGESAPGYYASMKVIASSGQGQRLFQQKGCIGCHSVGGKGGAIGPALDDVGLRRTPEWMVMHFREPQAVTPGTVMPKFGFTETEARALTDFLLHLRDQKVALSLPSLMGAVERGHEAFRKYGYMPGWGSTIKDAEVDDLVAYLVSLKPKGAKDEF